MNLGFENYEKESNVGAILKKARMAKNRKIKFEVIISRIIRIYECKQNIRVQNE